MDMYAVNSRVLLNHTANTLLLAHCQHNTLLIATALPSNPATAEVRASLRLPVPHAASRRIRGGQHPVSPAARAEASRLAVRRPPGAVRAGARASAELPRSHGPGRAFLTTNGRYLFRFRVCRRLRYCTCTCTWTAV